MTIDQQTRRRIARTGLTACDQQRACPGYTLYAPLSGNGEVYLLDINGEVAHQWQMPYPAGPVRLPAAQRQPVLWRQGAR